MQHDPIFLFSFILLFFIFISSIIIPLFLSSPPTNPKPTLTHKPETHGPTDSQLHQPIENDPNPTLESGQCGELNKSLIINSKNADDDEVERECSDSDIRPGSVRLDPFTSCSSVMQKKKMKPQYDEIMKCNESKKLTLSQVSHEYNILSIQWSYHFLMHCTKTSLHDHYHR